MADNDSPDEIETPQDPTQEQEPQEAPKKRHWAMWAVVGAIVVLVIAGVAGGGNLSSTTKTPEAGMTATKSTTSEEKPDTEEVVIPVTKSALSSSITKAAGLSADDYTDDSWAAFQAALDSARSVDGDDEATQDEVNSAHDELVNTMSALVERPFDPDEYELVDYESVARNPDDYKGQQLAFTGRVLQVIEGSSETDLRIATDGEYDDIVYVGYDPSILGGTRVLEDDSVTVYGTCLGLYTYKSTLGASISLPALLADSVVIN
jgi:hypothetical protein